MRELIGRFVEHFLMASFGIKEAYIESQRDRFKCEVHLMAGEVAHWMNVNCKLVAHKEDREMLKNVCWEIKKINSCYVNVGAHPESLTPGKLEELDGLCADVFQWIGSLLLEAAHWTPKKTKDDVLASTTSATPTNHTFHRTDLPQRCSACRATGGIPSATGGACRATGGVPSATGGACHATGGVPSATGGKEERCRNPSCIFSHPEEEEECAGLALEEMPADSCIPAVQAKAVASETALLTIHVMVQWDNERGFGKVQSTDGRELFVHKSYLREAVTKGAAVDFEISWVESKQQDHAKDVQLLKPGTGSTPEAIETEGDSAFAVESALEPPDLPSLPEHATDRQHLEMLTQQMDQLRKRGHDTQKLLVQNQQLLVQSQQLLVQGLFALIQQKQNVQNANLERALKALTAQMGGEVSDLPEVKVPSPLASLEVPGIALAAAPEADKSIKKGMAEIRYGTAVEQKEPEKKPEKQEAASAESAKVASETKAGTPMFRQYRSRSNMCLAAV
ncbi:unnamed protein product [Durusdinium trenchii]|uniref:CSD domain-containing protein n=1 Tax=Durusdinium trenchii TaxID=1381693 RepID=A0ABP0QJZ1_9DINO